MWLSYSRISDRKATELVNYIKPKVAISIQYGSVAGIPEDVLAFEHHVDPLVVVKTN